MSLFNQNRRATNSWRSPEKPRILSVSSRGNQSSKDRAYKMGALFLLMLALAGGAWAAVIGVNKIGQWLFSENDRFLVRKIDIMTTGKLPLANIREYGHIAEGMNLFAVNLDKVRRDLEGVPVVKSAQVRRNLPDELSVRITERTATARLGADDRVSHFAVDREGFVLGPSSRSTAIPSITGLREFGVSPGSQLTNSVLLDALGIIDSCDASGLGPLIRIASLDVSHDDYIEMRVAGGTRVWMSNSDVRRKLDWLAASLRKAEDMGKTIQFIDLTVDKNPPVQFSER